MTYEKILDQAKDLLTNHKRLPNYENDVKILLSFYAKISLAELYSKLQEEINFPITNFVKAIKKYNEGYPVQYLTNSQFFYGNNFYVNQHVLIPRYETEELVENISNFISQQKIWDKSKQLTIFDIGTGSGAIALSLALDYPKNKIYASDISNKAITVAMKNKKTLNCDNVTFLTGDMLKPFIEKKLTADILICNPPYIPLYQEISYRVKNYEPNVALFGQESGLYFYEQIFANYELVMNKPGILCFEHGYDQKKALEKLVHQFFPSYSYQFFKDINKKWRILFIYLLE